MKVQETIHKMEVGEGSWVIKVVAGFLLVTLLAVWYDLNEFQNLSQPDAMEAVQLARNLADGQGFTTQCIRPLTLQLVEDHIGVDARLTRVPHPDLVSPPLYPLLLAVWMKMLPFDYEIGPRFWRYQPEMMVALLNQLLLFVAIGVMFRTAKRLFDTPVALLTAACLVLAEVLWRFSVSGLSTCLLLLLSVVLLRLLVAVEQGAREGKRGDGWFAGMAVAIGAVLGLGLLTRYSFGWLVIPVAVYGVWIAGQRRFLVTVLLLVTFAGVAAPWLVRNYQVSGTLFGVPGYAIHQDTPVFPGTRLERSFSPDLSKVESRDYVRKMLANVETIMENDLPRMGGGSWVTAFFLVSLLLRYRSQALHRLRLLLLGCLVVLIVAQALGRTHLSTGDTLVHSENLLVLLLPPVFMFGCALFYVLLEQLEMPIVELRYLVLTAFIGVAASPLWLTLLPPRSYPIVYPPYLPPWIQESSRMMETNELIMSDMPWAVAWYGNRSCVWTTLDTSRSFFNIHDVHKPVSALYLTPLTTNARFLSEILQGPDWEWSRFATEVLMRTNMPAQFPLRHARKKYSPDQVFLCDRPRWQDKARGIP